MSRATEQISGRRLGALAAAAAGVPVFRVCCRVSWPWVLAGGLAAALTLSGLTCLCERRRQTARPPGKAALLLLPLLAAGALYAAWESGFAFEETGGGLLLPALILLLAGWAATGGPGVAGRCAVLLLRLTALLYGAVLLFSLPQLRPERLAPAGGPVDALRVWGALLLPGAALCLGTSLQHDSVLPHWPWWVSSLGALAASLVTGGILSAPLAAEREAFRTLSRGVSVLGVIRRFEALVNGAMLMSGFCLCALYACALRELLLALRREKASEKRF